MSLEGEKTWRIADGMTIPNTGATVSYFQSAAIRIIVKAFRMNADMTP